MSLPDRLREMYARRLPALTPFGEPQRYSITALEDRMGDLMTAADALERVNHAAKSAERTLKALDARMRECISLGLSAAQAYDSFYQDEVAQVIGDPGVTL